MKTSVYIATSLDGYIARENGDLDWLPGSQGNDSHDSAGVDEDFGYQEFMDSVDVLVMGRNTFEMVLAFGQWPYGGKRVVVLSSKLSADSDDLPETVEVRSGSPAEVIEELSRDACYYTPTGNGVMSGAELKALQRKAVLKFYLRPRQATFFASRLRPRQIAATAYPWRYFTRTLAVARPSRP